MKHSSTITTKGQVVIPKKIRDIYGLSVHTKVVFESRGSLIIIKPLSINQLNNRLAEKLASFSADAGAREDWEKNLAGKIKKWQW